MALVQPLDGWADTAFGGGYAAKPGQACFSLLKSIIGRGANLVGWKGEKEGKRQCARENDYPFFTTVDWQPTSVQAVSAQGAYRVAGRCVCVDGKAGGAPSAARETCRWAGASGAAVIFEKILIDHHHATLGGQAADADDALPPSGPLNPQDGHG